MGHGVREEKKGFHLSFEDGIEDIVHARQMLKTGRVVGHLAFCRHVGCEHDSLVGHYQLKDSSWTVTMTKAWKQEGTW